MHVGQLKNDEVMSDNDAQMNGLQTKQICARGSFYKVGYPNGGHWGAHLFASVTFTPFFLFSQVYTSTDS